MHIKKVLIKGFKAIRQLEFPDEFSPGHNVISEWAAGALARARPPGAGLRAGGARSVRAGVIHQALCSWRERVRKVDDFRW